MVNRVSPVPYCSEDKEILVPINKDFFLGEGAYGRVWVHGKDPSLAVKKSKWSLEQEFFLGARMNHENILKTHALFIKTPRDDKSRATHRLVMDRIFGKSLNCLYYTEQSPQILDAFLTASINSCLYLFDQGICWDDLKGDNVFVVDEGRKLLFADFGKWSLVDNIEKLGKGLLVGLRYVMSNILLCGSLDFNKVQSILLSEISDQLLFDQARTRGEVRQKIEGYGELVLRQFHKTLNTIESEKNQ